MDRKKLSRTSTRERFEIYVERGPGCWKWNGRLRTNGYGSLRDGNRGDVQAHRYSWEIHCGPIPDGLYVLHSCDNRPCCNPAHLFLGTILDNALDMRSKGRGAYQRPDYKVVNGERHGRAKLTDADVVEIRKLRAAGIGTLELGRRFGVHQSTIQRIVRGALRTGDKT